VKPSVGEIVHYTSCGTPGGEYGSECRAAIVTAVRDQPGEVDLAVLNPEGVFFNREVEQHEVAEPPGVGGTWHWPERDQGEHHPDDHPPMY
jgi:hypothetical protein